MSETARNIPLCLPDIGAEEKAAVDEVLGSGWLAHGPKNKELEGIFKKYLNVPHAVSLNSCASALFLVIKAAGIKGEVILPSFTFVASANAVAAAGAQCVFTDVDYDTCMITPEAIEAAITPKTEAIMVVHFAGQIADMDSIAKIAEKHNLLLIEDSAEAIGAEYKGKRSGAWGEGCFSFWPTKNITTGEGGMLTSRNEKLAADVKTLSGHGIASTTLAREKQEKPWLRAATLPGYNCRMSNILAALGCIQMKKLDAMNEARRKHAAQFNTLLNKEVFDLPVEAPERKHVYQMYTIKMKAGDRTKLLKQLKEKGIGASVHFDPPVHTQPYYAETVNTPAGSLPITDKLSDTIITLPMYPQMTEDAVSYVAEAVNEFVK